MAVTRKSKKKNTRIIIAVALAGVLALILFMIMSRQGSQTNSLMSTKQQLESQIQTLQKELDNQKKAASLQARVQQFAQPTKEEQQNTMSVVVAKRHIEAGTRLSYDIMETKEWPQEAVPGNAANFPESLLGRITSSDIASGEPVLLNKLIDKETQTLEIPEGHRALTIPISNITGVGGFLMPGSRVDLLTVVDKAFEPGSKSTEKVSKILLQNVKVLATSGGSSTPARGAQAASTATITIAVPASDATKIALAYDNGKGTIQTILRGFQDNTIIDKISTDTGELITGNIDNIGDDITIPDLDLPKPPSDSGYGSGSDIDLNSILNNSDNLPVPSPPSAQTKTHSIEIIQANSRQEVSFETEI